VLGPGHPCGDVAALLVGELFSNSLRHSGSGAPGETVTVAVKTVNGVIRVEVTDRERAGGSRTAPRWQRRGRRPGTPPRCLPCSAVGMAKARRADCDVVRAMQRGFGVSAAGLPGCGRLELAQGVVPLNPQEAVFEAIRAPGPEGRAGRAAGHGGAQDGLRLRAASAGSGAGQLARRPHPDPLHPPRLDRLPRRTGRHLAPGNLTLRRSGLSGTARRRPVSAGPGTIAL
jgi:hypothetical protein